MNIISYDIELTRHKKSQDEILTLIKNCIAKSYKADIYDRDILEKTWNDLPYQEFISVISASHLLYSFTIENVTIVRQVEYLYGKNIFSNLFTSHLLYNDLLYVNDLLFFERRPEVRITSKKNATIITYCYDHKKRVIESEHRNNGQYIGKTLYRYIEE